MTILVATLGNHDAPPDLGWGAVVSGRVTCLPLAGDHHAIAGASGAAMAAPLLRGPA